MATSTRHNTPIVWVHRKPRPLGNFSIETSFESVLHAWDTGIFLKPENKTVSRYSSGIIDRIRIWQEVQSIKCELIHISGDIYYSVIGMRNRKVILTIHDLGMIQGNSVLSSWLRRSIWLNLPLLSATRVIAVSNKTKEEILTYSKFPSEKIIVIPSVISSTYHRREQHPLNTQPRILHIGLADNKNLDRHAAALSTLDVHLRIIGEPSSQQHTMLQRHNVEYSHASKLSEAELQSEYAQSDVLLFCSTLEGFGMPIIEAQTIGLPVITSALAPMDDTAGEGALLVDPTDIGAIHMAVKNVTEDNNLRNALIRAGFVNAERFSPASAARRHAELYAELLKA